MINLLIADDNVSFNLTLSSFLTKEKDIKIIDMCLDGKRALLSYMNNKPDIMILDLDMPSLNGIEIINYLDKFKHEKEKQNIIVISGNSNLKNKLSALSKIYCILNKPCNFEIVLEKIKEIKINSAHMNFLKLSIFKYLQNLNFNMNSIGTIYLSEMILLNYSNSSFNNLKSLIHQVAIKNNLKYTTVKSAIYHSVDTMNRFIDIENIKSICPNYNGRKLTPYDIISYSKISLN